MPNFVSFLISSKPALSLGGFVVSVVSVVLTVNTLLLERSKDRTAARFNHILELLANHIGNFCLHSHPFLSAALLLLRFCDFGGGQ